jgi:hypothetical protein
VLGPSKQRSGQPVFGIGSTVDEEFGESQGLVNEDKGKTYPRIGLLISAPNAAGLEEKETTGERSTTVTVLSAPQAHPHQPLSEVIVLKTEEILGLISNGWE